MSLSLGATNQWGLLHQCRTVLHSFSAGECIHVFGGLPSSRSVVSLSLVDVPPPRSSLSLTHKPLNLRIKVSISDALFMIIIDKNDQLLVYVRVLGTAIRLKSHVPNYTQILSHPRQDMRWEGMELYNRPGLSSLPTTSHIACHFHIHIQNAITDWWSLADRQPVYLHEESLFLFPIPYSELQPRYKNSPRHLLQFES